MASPELVHSLRNLLTIARGLHKGNHLCRETCEETLEAAELALAKSDIPRSKNLTIHSKTKITKLARQLLAHTPCPYCQRDLGPNLKTLKDWMLTVGDRQLRLVVRGRCPRGHRFMGSCEL